MPPKKDPKTQGGNHKEQKHYLNISEKLKVFTYYKETKCSARKLAKIFNIGKTQAGQIIKKGETWLRLLELDNCFEINCKLRPGTAGFEIDRIVHEWYLEKKNENMQVTGPMIQSRALELSKEMGHSEFKASNGWLLRFLQRHKIALKPHQIKVNSENNVESTEDKSSKDVDLSDYDISVLQNWEKYLSVLLPKYSVDDIFCVVQTGLFYKAVPSNTSDLIGENCSCGKFSKKRCTVLFCVSMSGVKEKPIVVANIPVKEVKKLNKYEVECVADEKAWITKNTIAKWLKEMDNKMISEKRNIVLFFNNSVPHVDVKLKNIVIEYFPSSFTFENHPVSLRITQNFKIIYRQQLLRYLLELKDNESDTLPDQSISECQAVEWISAAWKEISESVICKSFEELGFSLFVKNTNITSCETPASLNEVSNLLCALDSDVSAVAYVSIDNDLVTWDNTESVEILIDSDDIKQIYTNNEEQMETEPKPELTIKSYSEALQCLKDLKQFYVAQNDSTSTFIVNQLIDYSEESITTYGKVKVENQYIDILS